jgi:outer membrane protein, heavy metal efflux system
MRASVLIGALLLAPWFPARADAQAPEPLDGLVAQARGGNPEILTARRMAEAAAARVAQAGALPDPMLSAGLMNVPVANPSLRDDPMTMLAVQLSQRLPPPGLRGARTAAAVAAYQAALLDAGETELDVVARLRTAYHELLEADESLAVLARNRALLETFAEIARARYSVGAAPQPDVLRAQTEITRLDEQLAAVAATRTTALTMINTILEREPMSELAPVYPAAVLALAAGGRGAGVFRVTPPTELGPDFPSLAELQTLAEQARPALRAQRSRVDAARAALRAAQAERRPMTELMVGYGYRPGAMDMVSVGVGIELPVFARRKQQPMVQEMGWMLAAAELEYRAMVSEVHGEVAARYGRLARMREQITLLRQGVAPQAAATVASAVAAYQSGRVEFLTLLDAQAMQFGIELELARMLSEFGAELAGLARAVGTDLAEGG